MTVINTSKLWTPQVVQGGKAQDPPQEKKPWLSDIESGTIFLAQNKKDLVVCGLWIKMNWAEDCSQIADPRDRERYIWVVDKDFSDLNRLKAILEHE